MEKLSNNAANNKKRNSGHVGRRNNNTNNKNTTFTSPPPSIATATTKSSTVTSTRPPNTTTTTKSKTSSTFKNALVNVPVPQKLLEGMKIIRVYSNGRTQDAYLTLSEDKFTLYITSRRFKDSELSNKKSDKCKGGGAAGLVLKPLTSIAFRSRSTSQSKTTGTSSSSNNDDDDSDERIIDIGSIDRIQRGQVTHKFELAQKIHKSTTPNTTSSTAGSTPTTKAASSKATTATTASSSSNASSNSKTSNTTGNSSNLTNGSKSTMTPKTKGRRSPIPPTPPSTKGSTERTTTPGGEENSTRTGTTTTKIIKGGKQQLLNESMEVCPSIKDSYAVTITNAAENADDSGTVMSDSSGNNSNSIKLDPQRSFSIIFRGERTLDLMMKSSSAASNISVFDEILDALDRIIVAYKEAKTKVGNDVLLLRYVWLDVAKSPSKTIDSDELGKVLQYINFNTSVFKNKAHLKTSYDKFGKLIGLDAKTRRKGLTFEHICTFLHKLKRDTWMVKPINNIWNECFGEFMSNGKQRTTVSDKTFLEKFLHKKQGEKNQTIQSVRKLFNKLNQLEIAHTAQKDDTSAEFYTLTTTNKDPTRIDKNRFEAYILSKENDAYDINKDKFDELSMKHPLSEYWISSSHNTYLMGDQLRSSSSIEMYLMSLYRGCRCLELDIWDSGEYEAITKKPIPIVWHGHTMTTKIKFVDIINAINIFLNFNSTNTYPIILSFENHCSIPYQEVMAEQLLSILGNKLYIPTESSLIGDEELPSPLDLRGMVIIKGKRPVSFSPPVGILPSTIEETGGKASKSDDSYVSSIASMFGVATVSGFVRSSSNAKSSTGKTDERAGNDDDDGIAYSDSDDESDCDSLECTLDEQQYHQEQSKRQDHHHHQQQQQQQQQQQLPKGQLRRSSSSRAANEATQTLSSAATTKTSAPQRIKRSSSTGSTARSIAMTATTASTYYQQQHGKQSSAVKKRIKIAPQLAKVTLFHGAKYKNWDISIQNPVNHMHSFNEQKVKSLCKQNVQSQKWTIYNQSHMSRVYPAGSRYDSSNYNPIPAWSAGCQMVALNFQTPDAPLRLNYGRFRENGNCGYVLKPSALMIKEDFVQVAPVRLFIRILSGSCLPKPKGEKNGDCISPFVQVSVYDIQNEQRDSCTSCNTTTIPTNGFFPIWNQEQPFDFLVENAAVAMLQLSVFDKYDKPESFVASSSIPISNLRSGYRSVQLFDGNNTRTGAFDFASLLIEVKMRKYVAEI